MQLSLQNFSTLMQNMAAGVQGASKALLDLSVGSVLRATLEGTASIALWLQWIALQVLSMTRASTSGGADLDSWVADFALTRLPATSAAGVATFSRFTVGQPTLLPVGATVLTSDGSQTFAIVVDPSNPAWSASSAGYNLGPTAASVDLPIQAVAAGAAGNVQAGAISQLATAIVGIDSVLNAAPTAGGADAESDAALRARFTNYINTRSQATLSAVAYAVQAVQQGLVWKILENVDAIGNTRLGNFVVLVDDGTGTPPQSLLAIVQTSVDTVRPVGSTFSVMAPQVVPVVVSLTLSIQPNANAATVSAAVQTAIQSWVDALTFGESLPLSRIAALSYAADPAVQNVSAILLNNANTDIIPNAFSLVKTSTVVVS